LEVTGASLHARSGDFENGHGGYYLLSSRTIGGMSLSNGATVKQVYFDRRGTQKSGKELLPLFTGTKRGHIPAKANHGQFSG
jgi:hypothetical protein